MVPHFPPLHFGPAFSGPAFSTPAYWCRIFRSRISTPAFLTVPHFPFSHFQSPRGKGKTRPSSGGNWRQWWHCPNFAVYMAVPPFSTKAPKTFVAIVYLGTCEILLSHLQNSKLTRSIAKIGHFRGCSRRPRWRAKVPDRGPWLQCWRSVEFPIESHACLHGVHSCSIRVLFDRLAVIPQSVSALRLLVGRQEKHPVSRVLVCWW